MCATCLRPSSERRKRSGRRQLGRETASAIVRKRNPELLSAQPQSVAEVLVKTAGQVGVIGTVKVGFPGVCQADLGADASRRRHLPTFAAPARSGGVGVGLRPRPTMIIPFRAPQSPSRHSSVATPAFLASGGVRLCCWYSRGAGSLDRRISRRSMANCGGRWRRFTGGQQSVASAPVRSPQPGWEFW